MSGVVVNDLIILRAFWQNKGAFSQNAFEPVKLARLSVSAAPGAYIFPCAENVGNDHAGTGFFLLEGNVLSWEHTDGSWSNVAAAQWHQGAIVAPLAA